MCTGHSPIRSALFLWAQWFIHGFGPLWGNSILTQIPLCLLLFKSVNVLVSKYLGPCVDDFIADFSTDVMI